MAILQELLSQGQSIWYDNISRGMLASGELKKKVEQGLGGVTSNPSIFEKAISSSTDYDRDLKALSAAGKDTPTIIQELMIADIQAATDVLRPVYDRSHGGDGFVSIEVTPTKARDTKGTIEEVRMLWKRINRPNLMVKIPATVEGLPAIQQMLSEGININITLIFSVERYRAVAQAYVAALTQRAAEGKPVTGIGSVASVFVSRIDSLVDGLLDKKKDGAGLKGKAALANAKMVYQAFREEFSAAKFGALAAKGAAVQRPLWASTGTKNPAYSDLLYVETLVGPHTVNTVPPATYDALLDHGKAVCTVEQGVAEARKDLERLHAVGIDMAAVTTQLEVEGVAAFEKSFDGLSLHIDKKRTSL